jgi:hypothetical protein
MSKIAARAVLGAALWASALSSCSDAELPVEPQPHEETREFSEADKRAARALSVNNTEVMANAETPYAQALLCRHGIAQVADLAQETLLMSGEQEQALRQAEALFDQRLQDLASAEGKSAAEVQADLEQVSQDNQDRATNLRVAASCLEQVRQS